MYPAPVLEAGSVEARCPEAGRSLELWGRILHCLFQLLGVRCPLWLLPSIPVFVWRPFLPPSVLFSPIRILVTGFNTHEDNPGRSHLKVFILSYIHIHSFWGLDMHGFWGRLLSKPYKQRKCAWRSVGACRDPTGSMRHAVAGSQRQLGQASLCLSHLM